jgi:hypothetical protein
MPTNPDDKLVVERKHRIAADALFKDAPAFPLTAKLHSLVAEHFARFERDTIAALSARLAGVEAAGEAVLVGGNHLALLIGADHPPYCAEPNVALEHYGAGDTYDIWCAWRSIMRLRTAMAKDGAA